MLAGRVVDRDTGRPVLDARVTVTCGAAETPTAAVTTDPDGEFGFFDLPPGDCTLEAGADGFVAGGPVGSRPREVRVDPDRAAARPLRLALSRAAAIHGTVTDGSRPLPGVTLTVVYLEAADEPDSFSVTIERTTDSRGRFQLDRLMPGRVQVLAEHVDAGFTETEDFYLRPGAVKQDLEIVMATGGAISGRVVDPAGRPVAGAKVRVFAADARRAQVVVTDEAGTFGLEPVAAGEASLVASAVGFGAAEPTAVQVEVGDELDVVLRLTPEPGFSGVVLQPDGEPAQYAAIFVVSEAEFDLATRGRKRPVTRADASGRFHVAGFEGYPAVVWANHKDYGLSEHVSVRADGAEVTLQLSPGTRLIGQAVDERGDPVTAYHVTLRPAARGARGRLGRRNVNAADGRFVLPSVAPGFYRLVLEAAGFVPLTSEAFEIPAGEETDAGVFTLRAGGGATGRVIDAETGEPVASARVHGSVNGDDFFGTGVSARTDAEGWFTLDGLPTQRLSLSIMKGGYVRRLVSGVEVSAGMVTDLGDITLTPSEDGHRRMQYSGVGARVRMTPDGLVFQKIFDGSPAADAGLSDGTTVLTINGQNTGDMSLRQAVELIRGEAGSNVQLQVIRPGSDYPEDLAVARGEVTTP